MPEHEEAGEEDQQQAHQQAHARHAILGQCEGGKVGEKVGAPKHKHEKYGVAYGVGGLAEEIKGVDGLQLGVKEPHGEGTELLGGLRGGGGGGVG